jgi:exosortase
VDPQPLPELIRSRSWQLLAGGLLIGIVFAFHAGIRDMVGIWYTKADYSHGFLVPFIAGYILYTRREKLPKLVEWPDPLGLPLILVGVALSLYCGISNHAREFGQGVGLILSLTGAVMLLLGRAGLLWAWPGLGFLLFMVKMPDSIEILFTFKLRQIATEASNFILQTIGYPSYIAGQGGTIIHVGDVRLGVEWACSGLSMVLTFVALGTAFAILSTQRPTSDRIWVFISSIPIAIISNIIRITITSIVYIWGWKWLGDRIVHDLAGWLMMPLAMGFMWAELRLIDWLFTIPAPPDRDAVLKSATMAAAASWVVPERAEVDDPNLAVKSGRMPNPMANPVSQSTPHEGAGS